MARDKKAWNEAKCMVDRIVGLIRRMDNSACDRKLTKKEYAFLIGVLVTAGSTAEAAYMSTRKEKFIE